MSLPVRAVEAPAEPQRSRGVLFRPAGSLLTRPTARAADELELSTQGRSMGNLVRTWGVLTALLGQKSPQGLASPPDLLALREALIEARRNLEEMRTRQSVLTTLKSSVLSQAERLVARSYGVAGDGARLRVVLEEDMGGALASVSYIYDRQGRMDNMNLHVSLSQFTPDTGPNGINDHVIENDRIIAHEMTHAMMGRSMDIRTLPDWFMEGTAEYVAGGAERVSLVLRRLAPSQLMARLAMPWAGDTTQYAAGYIAIRYLDHVTAPGGGIKEVMARLKSGDSLDTAITAVSAGRFADTRDFLMQVVGGEGERFMKSVDLSGKDPGSISRARGPLVVPDTGAKASQPLKGFAVQWPSPLEGTTWASGVPQYGGVPAGAAAYRFR